MALFGWQGSHPLAGQGAFNLKMAASSKKEILAAGKKRQRRRWVVFSVLTLIFLAIISIEIIFLLRSPGFLINRVLVAGASPYEQEKINQAVDLILRADCPCLIPRRSILFYPRDLIAAAVREASPRAGELELSLSGRTLILDIQERKPLALWCSGPRETKHCFFLDRNGVTFSNAPVFSIGVFPEFYQASSTVTLFTRPLPDLDLPSFLDFSRTAGHLLQRETSANLDHIEALTGGDLALVFRQGPARWRFLVNRQNFSDLVLGNLQAVLTAKTFRSSLQAGQILDYLDLRFTSKVFYKFQSTP